MRYPGLFNSSYVPSPAEIALINSPQNFIGPLLLAQIFATLLQGVFLVQYYEYVVGLNDHKKWTRSLVHTTAALGALKLGYICWLTWDTLSKNKYFVVPALIFLVVYFGAGIAQTWNSVLLTGGRAAVSHFGLISVNISIISGLLCNLFITGFTCWYLIKEMTGTRKTDNLVKKVIRISIESATGPTIAALLGLILGNLSSQNHWFLLPALVSSHVYACSLLYSVNSKKRLNGMMRNTITSNLYRPTTVRETEVLPTQLLVIDGDEPSGDRVGIPLQRLRDVFVNETNKVHGTLTQSLATDSSLAVSRLQEASP
ncbi:hypothetical protein Clacol_009216 [Clathrus columnatus]|uniref:DUF6534 domain-containing protein n=1 Tax=Clathrus columnatus TaxID=1419009 RepID=A0AAV5ARF8_9AGAM|nr:hypothetical protein Clacol_009216 [Clathrus columnatus]